MPFICVLSLLHDVDNRFVLLLLKASDIHRAVLLCSVCLMIY